MAAQGKKNQAADELAMSGEQWRRAKTQIAQYLDQVLDGEAWAQTGAEAADVITEILRQEVRS
ncbi:hypothetical protein DL991_21230 [Amycolatopsis sp. WAC 01375]|uniref:hypothetical protein n=1 Tax=Amycolatopsis sp. WAC 01375 TaxID=2203194 RepID=UPI000F78DE11|nr:hypothetical protein [Amycolatopsis sp. WAC 01375]RSM77072.1 hypothetical protein DL991_21230 [Amycolatopsis sp. WAC 01375]